MVNRKYIPTFEKYINDLNESMINEKSVIGKHKKQFKANGWDHSKNIDSKTLKELMLQKKEYLKHRPGLKTGASNDISVLNDDDPKSWETWTFNHPEHGEIKVISHKNEPFNARKYGTLFVYFNDTWRGNVRGDKSVLKEVTNILSNDEMLNNNSTSDIERGFDYWRFKKVNPN